jgi:hypothetical protein
MIICMIELESAAWVCWGLEETKAWQQMAADGRKY